MFRAMRLSGAYPKRIRLLSQLLHCYLETELLEYTDVMGEPNGYVSNGRITFWIAGTITKSYCPSPVLETRV